MYDKTVAWYQNLETEKDALPVLNNNHGKVYPSIPCATSFSNTPDIASQPHVFGEGLTCTVCGNYDKPSQASDGTYQISNASQLYWFATSVNNGNVGINGSLEADIQINRNVLDDQGNLNGSGDDFEMWIPIGTGTNQYKGIFDGKGHTINGLFFKNTVNKNYPYGGYYVGLFGYVGGAKIKNVGLVDSYIQGSYSVGGICGSEARYTHSQIINCYNTGTIKGSYYIGGICGLYCEQHNCYNAGIVSGEQSVGGICGYSSELVKHCYNIGKVSITGDGAEVGGICVYAGKVDGCYCLEDCAPSAGGGFFATSEDFASGKITYLLNGCETNENNVWYQKLGATPDAFPVLDKNHGRVYASEPCLIMFGNSPVESIAHVYEDGQCTVCGEYEPATIVDGVYQIARPSDLYWFASYVNKGNTNINGILTADIIVNVGVLNDDGDLNSASSDFKNWTPIGTSSVIYGGVFDGNGHIISGLYFNNGSENMVGLFGYANGATIKNVGVVDSYFKGYEYVGGICGYSYSTKTNITNCYNAGTIVGNSRYIGGICGYCYTGRTIITNCYNLGKIDGNHERVGGISGDGGNLKNCFNAGTVKGKNYYTGGICGAGGEQTNCYNIGDVFGDINVGGICGYYGDQTNCYNVGNVTGTSYGVGGISGVYGTAVNCYYLAGCAKVGDDVEQYGIGCEEVGQALEDEEGTVSATNYDFKSGKIGFLLNGGANAENIEWYQTIGTDAFPVLNNNHDVIYASAPCPFSNNESGIAEHKFDTLEFLAPTCTEAGFSGNLLCKICGYYEQGYSIDALGHAYDTVAVAATCTADGYKELTCSRCNHVEHIDAVPAEGHKPAAAVFENVVAATCTAVGSYDSVVYCTVCKTELSRDKKTVSAAGHKADSVAFENVVEATRTTAGSYDSVVYCSVCKAELSRTTIEVPQIVAETIKLTSKPNKVDYKQGETLDVKGGKIAIGYSDKSTEEFEILAGWVSGFDSQKVGEQKLTVTFESVSSTLTTTFNVTVSKEDDNTNNTAIDEDAANVVNIYAYKNTIVVENATDDILVYNTMGALICRDAMHCVRKEIIISTPGVYIVKTGNTAKRVMVY